MKIYIEGAGPSEAARTECQKAFAKFFESAGLKGRMPRTIACGSRNEAFDKFKTALKIGEDALLLIDSEEPVPIDSETGKPVSPWNHVEKRDGWNRPDGATDDQIHFMVVCMESWFIADRQQFIRYYSTGNRRCNENAIPDHNTVELILKQTAFHCLKIATSPSGNAQYSKGTRSFDILAIIRPEMVAVASYHARRLFCRLKVDQTWLDCSEFE